MQAGSRIASATYGEVETREAAMFKVITLLKRKPGLSVEAFQSHWRERHAPLVAKLPGLMGYVQSHALLQGYTKGELLFDGISEEWFADANAYAQSQTSRARSEVLEAEAAFLDQSRTVRMPVDVYVIKSDPVPPNPVKNIEFVNRRPGMELQAFRRYWRNVHGPLAAQIPVLRRYEQNHLCMSEYTKNGSPAYDGLAITWFASTADMKRGTTTPEYIQTRADEPFFLPDGHLPIIITREHIIRGQPPFEGR
jgi:uncharacterized protein (TIGR02118 family)